MHNKDLARFYQNAGNKANDDFARMSDLGGGGGGGAGAFNVTITDIQQYYCTVDKSYDEIFNAMKNGQPIQLVYEGGYAPCGYTIDVEYGYMTIYPLSYAINIGGYDQIFTSEGADPYQWSFPD